MRSLIAQAEWKFGINDPTLVAWVVFSLYLIATLLCWGSERIIAKAEENKRGFSAWSVLSISLFMLAINKQLDLHTLVIPRLREFQINYPTALLGIAIAFALATIGFVILWRPSLTTRMKVSAVALFLIVAFQALRFSSMPISEFLTMHPFVDQGLFHTHIIEVIESILIGLICYCACPRSVQESGVQESN